MIPSTTLRPPLDNDPSKPTRLSYSMIPGSTRLLIIASMVMLVVFLLLSVWACVKTQWFRRRTKAYERKKGGNNGFVAGKKAKPVSLAFGALRYFPVQTRLGGLLSGVPSTTPILDNLSGYFESGTLTAIMGPSGSGKTTLLNLLCGRTRSGVFSGVRLYDGHVLQPQEFEARMKKQGYVMQTDEFFEDLTVRETLIFSAMLQLGDELDTESKLERVDEVLDELGLSEASDKKVGGQTFKGISGGQRRRLSIAIELLSLPSIIMLDEPTSGLDATSSLKLIETLKHLARNGHTIVTTIHQPRPEIMDLFDRLVVLAKGGRMVYFGEPSDAVAYLRDAGVHLDEQDYSNVGDFIIDAVGLDPERDRVGEGVQNVDLPRAYIESERSGAVTRSVRRLFAESNEKDLPDVKNSKFNVSFFTQTWLLFARRWQRTMGNARGFLLEVVFLVVVGMILAIAFSYHTDGFGQAYEDMMYLLLVSSFLLIVQYLTSVPDIFAERPILQKERDSGYCRLSSYVLSLALIETPRAVFQCVLLGVIGYWIVELSPSAPAVMFFFIILIAGVISWQSMVSLCCFMTDDIGFVYSLLFAVLGLGSLFGGFVVTYSRIPPWLKWVYYTSISAYMQRALVVNDLLVWPTITCDQAQQSVLDIVSQTPQLINFENGVQTFNCTTQTENNQQGNLGQITLVSMELASPFTFHNIPILVFLAIVLRLLTYTVQRLRDRLSKRLVERERTESLEQVLGKSAAETVTTREAQSSPPASNRRPRRRTRRGRRGRKVSVGADVGADVGLLDGNSDSDTDARGEDDVMESKVAARHSVAPLVMAALDDEELSDESALELESFDSSRFDGVV